MPDTSDTSVAQATGMHTRARLVTRVRHECYTNVTSTTQVLHERHESDTNEKFWFWSWHE